MPPPSPPPPVRRHLLRSFGWALTGLAETALREQNLRIHLALGVLASAFAAIVPLEAPARALVLATVAAVIVAEALNSAIEAALDVAAPGWDDRARIAKDAAAGAVLAAAAGSVLVLAALAPEAVRAFAVSPRRVVAASLAALTTAVAAGALPLPAPRARWADVALTVAGIAGLWGIGATAVSQVGTAAAALLLGVAADAARRRPASVRWSGRD